MQASNLPTKVLLPFANAGIKNAIPLASQVGITPGAASLTDGFPSLTMTPLASGGVPPAGADFNGILNLITGVQQWQSAGGIFKYDSAFSTSVGGYPKGAVLESSDGSTLWLCLADNNTTDPDGATPANWAPAASYGIAAVTGLTNANVTLTPAQYSRPIITLSGTLTGNVQIIFPTLSVEWLVANNTTGAFTVTCKTASGTGAAIAQGGQEKFYGDGTNLVQRLGNTPLAGDNSAKLATTAFVNSNAVTKDSNTGAANLPAGTTAQRPGSPASGMARVNTDLGVVEAYIAGAWGAVGKLVQVQYVLSTTTVSTTSLSGVAVDSVSITPISSSSKIVLLCFACTTNTASTNAVAGLITNKNGSAFGGAVGAGNQTANSCVTPLYLAQIDTTTSKGVAATYTTLIRCDSAGTTSITTGSYQHGIIALEVEA